MGHVFGFKPWDVDRLTIPQLNAYLDWAVEYFKSKNREA